MQRNPRPSAVSPRRVAAVTAVLVLSLITAVSAQAPVTLHMQVGAGSRTLEITDLALQPLSDLTLVPGRPMAYRAAVNDLDYAIDETFTVTTENNNLYLVAPGTGDPDFATSIASGEVSLAVGPDISVLGELLDVLPLYELTAGDTVVACTAALAAVLDLDLGLVSEVDVCTALEGASVPIVGDLIDALDIDGLLADLLALSPGAGGTYDSPSFAAGTIGAADPAATMDPGTPLTIMTGTPLLALGADLLAAITDRVAATIGALPTETPGVDPAAVIGALVASGQAELMALADGLAGLADTSAQEGIINAVLALVPAAVDLSVIEGLTGAYSAVPSITANAPAGTAPGEYTGTHLVTLISG